MAAYKNIKLGDKVSELELRKHNLHIYNNTLQGVPNGEFDNEGYAMYLIESIQDNSIPLQKNDIKSFMGDNVNVTRYPILSIKFDRGVNPNGQKATIVGSGGFQIVGELSHENIFRLQTGATAGSTTRVENVKYMNYQAGYEFQFAGTPYWSHSEVPLDVELLAGLFDEEDGYAIGFAENEEEWGFLRISAGIREFIPQSQFNLDKADGTGISGFNLNIKNGNIYRIRTIYFGFGPAVLEVQMGTKWISLHVIIFPNTSKITNVTETYLPLSVSVKNGINAENYYIDVASANVSILIDPEARSVNHRVFSDSFNKTVSNGTNIPIIAFKSKTDIQLYGMPSARENRIVSDLRGISLRLQDQNKQGTLLLAIVPETDVTGGLFISKDADISVVEISEDVTSVDLTNAVNILENAVGKTDQAIDLKVDADELPGLRAGYVAVLLYTTNAPTTEFSGTFRWDEQH